MVRILASLPLVVLAAAALADPAPPGKYRQEIRNPFRGDDYTLVRTLNLSQGGKAELYSEYRGEQPVVGAIVRDALGGLMREVREHRKVKHFGSWRTRGSRIEVELTRLEAGGEERSFHSAFEFERTRSEIVARSQDTADYGDRVIRMELLEDWDGGEQGDDFDPGSYRGTYGWGTEVKSSDGESHLLRWLKLNSDGSAELISEYKGRKPRLDDNSKEEFGALFAEVVANRKITHRGNWREIGGLIRVELSRVGGGDFSQSIASTLIFDPRGSDLELKEGDRSDYGSRSFRLRKDWRFEGMQEDRPSPIPNRPRDYPQLDDSAEGGGMLSHEGAKALELDRARLILRKDGSFEIQVQGDRTVDFRGKFEVDRNNTLTLTPTDAFGGRASGAGKITLLGGRIGTIVLRGEERGRRFTLNFTARPGR